MGETTDVGENMDESDESASVTECNPVDCVANACCTPSVQLDTVISSPRRGVGQDRACVNDELREDEVSRVGVLVASTGDGDEVAS